MKLIMSQLLQKFWVEFFKNLTEKRSILQTLRIVAKSTAYPIRGEIDRICEQLKEGFSLSEAMTGSKFFCESEIQMIRIEENSANGKLKYAINQIGMGGFVHTKFDEYRQFWNSLTAAFEKGIPPAKALKIASTNCTSELFNAVRLIAHHSKTDSISLMMKQTMMFSSPEIKIMAKGEERKIMVDGKMSANLFHAAQQISLMKPYWKV